MKVFTVQKSLTTHELVEILKREYSDKYTYTFFGLDANKSVIVRKSNFIGAQVYIKENEITVTGLQPTVAGNLFMFIDFLMFDTALMSLFFGPSCKELEKEVAVFLKQKLKS